MAGPIPGQLEDPDFANIIKFFADLVGKLDALPLNVQQQLQKEGTQIAGAIANTLLPRVSFLAPDFPFAHLFDRFEDKVDRVAAEQAVTHVVEELRGRIRHD